MVDKKIGKIIYVYRIWQPAIFDSLQEKGVEFRKDIHENDLAPESLNHERTLLILDDVFHELSESFLYNVWTNISHHFDISICLVLQYLFMKTKISRLLSSNCHYTCLFRNSRDLLTLRVLNNQIFPHKPGFLPFAYQDATQSEKYSSLLIDCSPHSDFTVSVRRSAFPDESKVIVYLPELK